MNNKQLKQLIVETLKEANMYSTEACELVLGTIAQESAMGKYIKQLGGGPALGICQMESATFWDIVNNFIAYRRGLEEKILSVCNLSELDDRALVFNLKFSILMCRIHYYRVSAPIPLDLEGQADYWKRYYNTNLGKGTSEEYIKNYHLYVS